MQKLSSFYLLLVVEAAWLEATLTKRGQMKVTDGQKTENGQKILIKMKSFSFNAVSCILSLVSGHGSIYFKDLFKRNRII